MNKAELILEVAERANLSKGEAENAVEEMISIIEKELIKGNDVKLSGFGVFSKKTRLARKGTNPSSGDIIVIPENNTVSFRRSKLLKEKVN